MLRHRLVWFGLGVITYLGAGALRSLPGVVETAYARGVGPWFALVLSRLTGWIPLSVAEFCYVAYAAVLARAAFQGIRSGRAGTLRARDLAVLGVTRVGRDAGVLVVLFYVLWGFNYSRAPLNERLGWPAWSPVAVEEVVDLAGRMVEAGNAAYLAVHDTTDAGEPTTLPMGRVELSRVLETGWRRAAERLNLPRSVSRHYGATKHLLASHLFARLGISGIYFPYTGEANVRGDLPAVALPQSTAHEEAHQRGIGVEAEASFLGYIAAASTDDPYVRYSAILFAQRTLMNGLARRAPAEWRRLNEERLSGIRRDLEDLYEHYRRFQGIGTRVGTAVNDSFLRANRVEGGVLNYGLAGRLVITFARENGGNAVP